MACRMETDADAIHNDTLAPFQRLVGVGTETQLQQWQCKPVTEIAAASRPGMIAMGMCDHGLVNRPPGVYIKLSLGTVKSFIGKFDERHINSRPQYFHPSF